LISFANYIDQNSQLFNRIEFINVPDKDIFNFALMNTEFDYIAIKQDRFGDYSIVKQ
jgi:hypothetical protein